MSSQYYGFCIIADILMKNKLIARLNISQLNGNFQQRQVSADHHGFHIDDKIDK